MPKTRKRRPCLCLESAMRVCLFVALAAVVSHAGAIALRANSTATDSADDTDEPNDPASKQIAAFPSQQSIMTELLAGRNREPVVPYDKNSPPNFKVAEPMTISYRLTFDFLHSVSEATGTVTCITSEWAYWVDKRLSFSPDKYGVGAIFLASDQVAQVWNVQVKFMNVLSFLTREEYFFLKSTGYVTRFTKGVTESHFDTDFSLFPFDKQGICIYMRLASELAKLRYATSKAEADLKWKTSNPCNLGHHTEHSVWTVLRATSNSSVKTLGTRNVFDYLTGCMIVQRRITNYLTKLLLPALMITLIACVSFWIDPRAVPARTGLLASVILTHVAFQLQSGKELPPVAYLTLADWHIMGHFVLICLAYVEYLLVHFKLREATTLLDDERQLREKMVKEETIHALVIDKMARVVMPLSAIAWTTFIILFGTVSSWQQFKPAED